MHKRNYFLISLLVFLLALVFVLISVKKDIFLQPTINGVQLTWIDNSGNEAGFKIERSIDGVIFVWIADVLPNVITYIDSNIVPATTYYYRVYAHNLNGNSGYTNSASISTFICTPSTTRSCSTALSGQCSGGTETCSSTGIWSGTCVQTNQASPELCNGLDDDCDGSVDEHPTNPLNSLSQSCAYSGPIGTVNVGICSAGLRTCGGGVWGTCSGEVTPQTEVCNNLDDNCNGVNDEGIDCSAPLPPGGLTARIT